MMQDMALRQARTDATRMYKWSKQLAADTALSGWGMCTVGVCCVIGSFIAWYLGHAYSVALPIGCVGSFLVLTGKLKLMRLRKHRQRVARYEKLKST